MVSISKSPEKTQEIATKLTKKIKKSEEKNEAVVVALEGELGAGKTVFVKGFARALGVKNKITSPTFVILKRYVIQGLKFKHLYHIDAYRLKDHKDLIPLGIKEIFSDPGNIVLIEWAERVEKAIPKSATRVCIGHINNTKRRIEISK